MAAMANKMSIKSAKLAKKAGAKRVDAKAAKPRRRRSNSPTGAQAYILAGDNSRIERADSDAHARAYIAVMPD
jgi:hypothetical protein